jgi:uncharacterized protein (DUF488 family)
MKILKSSPKKNPEKYIVYTIGHSNRSLDKFIAILRHYNIDCIVDVRSIPKSFHNPQFNKDSFKIDLKKQKIKYFHLKGLGGLRHAKKDSVNTGWNNASFRGFADYMQTPAFRKALKTLVKYISKYRVAIMCAESLPWHCHRSLISDALIINKIQVEDIFSKTIKKSHFLTSFAKVKNSNIIYANPLRDSLKD